MTSYIKIFALLFCAALLLSCWSELDCLHCKECFFEEDCNLNASSSSSLSIPSGLSSSSRGSSSSAVSGLSSSSRGSSSSAGSGLPSSSSLSSNSSSDSSDSSSSGASSSSISLERCGNKLYNTETQFCDERGPNVYEYGKIGSKTWMKEDLKFDNCWQNSCGLLNPEYNSMYYVQTFATSLCPTGWELPSINDFDAQVFDPNAHDLSYGGYYDGSDFKNKNSISSLYCTDGSILKVIQITKSGGITAEPVTKEYEMHSVRCVKREN